MTTWYEPVTFGEWIKRSFSLLNLLILSTAALLVISELRFDWCELMIGRYLAAINETRPETGAIWKAGEQSSKAHTYLKTIIEERQNAARYAQEATSLSELASGILPGQWANVDRDHFKRLYLALPSETASELISPTRLIWLYGGPQLHEGKGLHRIFCEGKAKGLEIFFLNDQNRVLHHINLTQSKLNALEKGDEPVRGVLEDFPEFQGHIYPADLFFDAVFKLPNEMLSDLITTPQMLLESRGDIIRVGIWNEVESGYIRLGFELETEKQRMVKFVRAREWVIWRLSTLLTGKDDGLLSQRGSPSDKTPKTSGGLF